MGARETTALRVVWKHASLRGLRLFRNNVGVGVPHETVRAAVAALVSGAAVRALSLLRSCRPIRYGLAPGSSDLIGWTPVTITQEHVGLTLAVFTAFEVKTDTGASTPAQRNFIDRVREAGGIAGVVRCPGDVDALTPTPPETHP